MRSQPFTYSILAVAALGFISNQPRGQQKSPSPTDMVKAAGAKPTPHTPDGHPDLNGIGLLPGIVSNAFGYGCRPGEVSAAGKEHAASFDDRGFVGQSPTPTLPSYNKPELDAQRMQLDASA